MFDDVDVEPPRATGSVLSRSVRHRWSRASAAIDAALDSTFGGAGRALGRIVPAWSQIDLEAVFLSIIPGLGHLRRRDRRRGGILLGLWIAGIATSLVMLGTTTGALAFVATLGVHTYAIFSFISAGLRDRPPLLMMAWSMLLFLCLHVAVYSPVLGLVRLNVRWTDVQGVRDTPQLANGDVVLYDGRLRRPGAFARGDVVLYRIHSYRGAGLIINAGAGIDRVLGLPGDRVRIADGEIFVNNQPLARELYPLGPVGGVQMELSAGPDEYIILPSTLGFYLHGQAGGYLASALGRVAVVEEGSILGRVWWRVNPWSRFGPLE